MNGDRNLGRKQTQTQLEFDDAVDQVWLIQLILVPAEIHSYTHISFLKIHNYDVHTVSGHIIRYSVDSLVTAKKKKWLASIACHVGVAKTTSWRSQLASGWQRKH